VCWPTDIKSWFLKRWYPKFGVGRSFAVQLLFFLTAISDVQMSALSISCAKVNFHEKSDKILRLTFIKIHTYIHTYIQTDIQTYRYLKKTFYSQKSSLKLSSIEGLNLFFWSPIMFFTFPLFLRLPHSPPK
jgi:hypothetical protein